MLIFQRDYITIDLVEKPTIGELKLVDWYYQFFLNFTIQCNGKIKRHSTSIDAKVVPYWTWGSDEEFKELWKKVEIEEWIHIYEAIDLLDSLWYELDKTQLQQWIREMLDQTIPH